jgi:hypothetical protein
MKVKGSTRIRIAAVVIAFAAVILWLAQSGGEVRVTFAGRSPSDSSLVSFTITNSFKTGVVYFIEGQEETGGVWSKARFWYTNYTGKIMERGVETFQMRVDSTKRWRVFVVYGHTWSTSSLDAIRARFARYAANHNWMRLSQWLKPPSRFKRVSGPQMIGNEVAPVPTPRAATP